MRAVARFHASDTHRLKRANHRRQALIFTGVDVLGKDDQVVTIKCLLERAGDQGRQQGDYAAQDRLPGDLAHRHQHDRCGQQIFGHASAQCVQTAMRIQTQPLRVASHASAGRVELPPAAGAARPALQRCDGIGVAFITPM